MKHNIFPRRVLPRQGVAFFGVHPIRLPLVALLCFFGCALLWHTTAFGASYPSEGRLTKWTQPDGTELTLRVFGDEFYAYTTTDDGYTVELNPDDGAYYYAESDTSGESIQRSGRKAHRTPPARLRKHLWRSEEEVEKRREARVRQYAPNRQAKWRAKRDAHRARKQGGNGKHGAKGNVGAKNGAAGDTAGNSTRRAESPEDVSQPGEKTDQQLQAQAGVDGASSTGLSGDLRAPYTSTASAVQAYSPVSGNKVGLMILIQFPDDHTTAAFDPVNFPTSQNKIERMANQVGYADDGHIGSIRDYFYDQSNGMLTHTQVVTPIVTLPHSRAYYNYADYPSNSKYDSSLFSAFKMLQDAVALLQSDGYVFPTNVATDVENNILATSVLYAGPDSGNWTKGLWPHASGFTKYATYCAGLAAAPDKEPCEVSPPAKIDIGTPGSPLYIDEYQITNLETVPVIGTIVHELGHLLLDYPDLYDRYEYTRRRGCTKVKSAGLGEHALMSGGNYVNDGKTPAPISLYLKEVSGWATVTDFFPLNVPQVLSVTSTANDGHRFYKPGSSTEYFLVENRGQGDKWATHVPDRGIMIWHVDEAVTTGNDNEHRRPEYHYEISLEQADGEYHLEESLYCSGNSGDNGDLFDNGSGEFSQASTPNSSWWDGTLSDVYFEFLSAPAATMYFNAYPEPANSTLAWALDTEELLWGTGGDAIWSPQTLYSNDGEGAAESGPISHNQSSYVETRVEGPGTLSFFWKVSSEENYDFLHFYQDGVEQGAVPAISGDVDWHQVVFPVTGGSHVMRWAYTKDVSNSPLLDSGWLDQVVFTPIDPVVTNTNDSGSGSLRQLISDFGAGATLSIDPVLAGQTITLNSPLLIDKAITIDGLGLPVPTRALPNGITFSGDQTGDGPTVDDTRIFTVTTTGNLTLRGVTLSDGYATDGGAIRNEGVVWLQDSTLSNNYATSQGGAIANYDGAVDLDRVTLSGNYAGSYGGAILNLQTSLPAAIGMLNTTLADNDSGAYGGAIFNQDATLALSHTTLSNNNAQALGGAVFLSSGVLDIENTLVGDNSSPGGADIYFQNGAINPAGANFIGNNDTVSGAFAVGDLVGTSGSPKDPQLMPLAPSSGRSETLRPRPSSPVIDAAVAAFDPASLGEDQGWNPGADQRGETRPWGLSADIGAFEEQPTFAEVTNLLDDGSPGSLRVVLSGGSNGGIVRFAAALNGQTIVLGSLLALDRDVTITADNLPGGITLDGNDATQLLHVQPGVQVSIERLTFTGGSGNHVNKGGAIRNQGTLTLTDSTITDNHVSFQGGAVDNEGHLTLQRSTVSNNSATSSGGGVANNEGTVVIKNSTLTGNSSAQPGYGGGGALYNYQGNMRLLHSTVTSNVANHQGGGVHNNGGTLTVENSIVAANTATANSSRDDLSAVTSPVTTIIANGANHVGDISAATALYPEGPLVENLADPLLEIPGYYGGFTATAPPQSASPVIDEAVERAFRPATDQRGAVRPGSGNNDLGAAEYTLDVDGDGLTAAEEAALGTSPYLVDTDGDGVNDDIDALPLDATEWLDTDGDRTGNNADTDDDNDTIPDWIDQISGRDPLVADWTMDAGSYHNCAVGDGSITCWGYNNLGQILVPELSFAQRAAGGRFHSCAIDDNGVSCWGDNGESQAPATVAGLTDPQAIDGGTFHSCALDNNDVTCWGAGQTDTGYPHFGQSMVPTLVNPRSVTTGNLHTCALDDSGVQCWGDNNSGQTVVPVLVRPTVVSASGSHTCAVDVSGLQCWGANTDGQITVPALSNAWMVAAGGSHTCAIDDTGVVCWGRSDLGQTAVPPLANPVALRLGYGHSCAMHDGGIACWGYNATGQANVPTLPFDMDLDGLADSTEDSNGNGVVDAGETDRFDADSDSDGLGDGTEDSNANGVVDAGETDPRDSDSDDDGLDDGAELIAGTDPTVSNLGDLAPRGSPDNVIDVGDLLVLSQLLSGALQPSATELVLGDVNGDGILELGDLLQLQRQLLQVSTP